MGTKEEICLKLKDEILTSLETLSHNDLLRKEMGLLNNIPGSGGVWYNEIALLCSLIDNKIAVDKLNQSAWDRWGYPLVLEAVKAIAAALIPFVLGWLLGSHFPDLLSTK